MITIASVLIILLIVIYCYFKIKKNKAIRDCLLNDIQNLTTKRNKGLIFDCAGKFQLNIEKIQQRINKNLNETDQKVLNILLENPVITNKELADKVCLSIDGVGSSLRRMYDYFNIKESKYKKISLLLEAIRLSN